MYIDSMSITRGLLKEKTCFYIEGCCLNRKFSNKYSETRFIMRLRLHPEIDEAKESNRSLFSQEKERDFV